MEQIDYDKKILERYHNDGKTDFQLYMECVAQSWLCIMLGVVLSILFSMINK